MKRIPDIEERLQKTLDSLDGIQRATPRPYFYTRLKARIDKEEKGWSGVAGLISRPAFAMAIVAVILFVNSWILLRDDKPGIQAGANAQIVTDVPEEYNVAITTFYDYETSSPE